MTTTPALVLTPADPAAQALALVRSLRIWAAGHPGDPLTLTPHEFGRVEALADAYVRARDAAEKIR